MKLNWIDIQEKLPDEGVRVLGYRGVDFDNDDIEIAYLTEEYSYKLGFEKMEKILCWYSDNEYILPLDYFTHWACLDEIPKPKLK